MHLNIYYLPYAVLMSLCRSKQTLNPYIPLDTVTLHVTYQLMLPIAHKDVLHWASVTFTWLLVGYHMKLFLYYVDILSLLHMSLSFNYPLRCWCNFVYRFGKYIYSNICNNLQPQSIIDNIVDIENPRMFHFSMERWNLRQEQQQKPSALDWKYRVKIWIYSHSHYH